MISSDDVTGPFNPSYNIGKGSASQNSESVCVFVLYTVRLTDGVIKVKSLIEFMLCQFIWCIRLL